MSSKLNLKFMRWTYKNITFKIKGILMIN